MIICACLVAINAESEILLVKVRDNAVWYLPGGKVEANEEKADALSRELSEELNIHIFPDMLTFQQTYVGENHDETDTVELHCFTTNDLSQLENIQIDYEISDVRWVSFTEQDIMAPAVKDIVNGLSGALQE